jgi:hypothetical protein
LKDGEKFMISTLDEVIVVGQKPSFDINRIYELESEFNPESRNRLP